ncbi:MAG: mitochondrial fission ELM1 family protein [Opitutales bacterium]|nr:mitochondrial fission ELM1 family protein [Opitutales bacterium]
MLKKPSQIVVVSDGRPGHENQSVGLAEALQRRVGVPWEKVSLQGLSWGQGIRTLGEHLKSLEFPLVIGAGHRTHIPMAWQRWRHKVPTVVIMRPSLPLRFFDVAVIPRHDGGIADRGGRVWRTFGALNRIPETLPNKSIPGMILIGGPSRHHGWDEEKLEHCLQDLLPEETAEPWLVTNSRRTPAEFCENRVLTEKAVEFFPHEQTGPGWLPEKLLQSREVWVTEDSMSMIYEALTAGARVGILPMPRLNKKARVIHSVEDLRREGRVVSFADWQTNGFGSKANKPFHETGRIADAMVDRFFR